MADVVFEDVAASGKKRPWREKKLQSLYYADVLEMLKIKAAYRVKGCGEHLTFRITGNGVKLYQAYFCQKRLCPVCMWRRSMKQSGELISVLNEAVKQQPTGIFLFLTLTMKNVIGKEGLSNGISQQNDGFKRLFQYKKVAKNLLGYFRALEVTVNKEDGSYHPHTHVLLMVKPGYFNGTANYIPQTQWTKLFRKAMKLDYDPVVNVQRVKPKPGVAVKDAHGAALEAAKYQVKSADYLTHDADYDQTVVSDLEAALSKRRLVTYGLLFHQIYRQLKLDKKADDLIHVDGEDNDDEPSPGELVVVRWNQAKKNYFIVTNPDLPGANRVEGKGGT